MEGISGLKYMREGEVGMGYRRDVGIREEMLRGGEVEMWGCEHGLVLRGGDGGYGLVLQGRNDRGGIEV